MDQESLVEKENMQVMQVPTSPSFLRPKPIKLRKRIAKPKTVFPLNEVNSNNEKYIGYIVKTPLVSRNPFKRPDNKRTRTESENEDSLLWQHINRPKTIYNETKTLPSPVVPSMFDESALFAFSDTVSTKSALENEKVLLKPKTKVLPVDWSLKTKIRFTSPSPFPSRGSFRTFEEVNGTIGFVRCLHSGDSDSKTSDVHSSHGAKFFQNCLVWMHPYLPWMNLFPRMDTKITSKSSGSSCMLDSSALETLHSKWCDSFRSLYQLVRLYQCPYFYMCTPTFTVLFRCAGAASVPVLHALLSPSTKGLRNALREEGISFTMPFCHNKDCDSGIEESDDNLPSPIHAQNDDSSTENKDNEVEDDEPESWLESLGLSQEDFPSFNKKKRNELSYKIDHKPESLIYVEDSETQALVNFFLNSHFCSAKIGPMAKIPPTLLAPTAFLGGTLQPLTIRHGKVKVNDKEQNSVEVSGPLLPNTIHSLCQLFNSTQDGNFQAAATPHAPTTPFSMVNLQSPMLPCIFAKNNMTDCGLPEAFVDQMCSKPEEQSISTIQAEMGLFSWS